MSLTPLSTIFMLELLIDDEWILWTTLVYTYIYMKMFYYTSFGMRKGQESQRQ